MVKTYKLSSQRSGSENISAFSIYKSNDNKLDGSESTSQSQERNANHSAATNVTAEDHETKSNLPSSSSTSFMKHISHKSVFPFRRPSTKRKKKSKKEIILAEDNGRPSRLPEEACEQGPLRMAPATEKSSVFPFRRGKFRASLQSDKKSNKPLHLPRIYENRDVRFPMKNSPMRRYKDDRSIELSTSRSMTGNEDNDDEEIMFRVPSLVENLDPNSNKVCKTAKEFEITDEPIQADSPPCKKKKGLSDCANRDSHIIPKSESNSASTSVQANDVEKTSKFNSKQQNSITAANISSGTTDLSTSKVPKMPFPAGNSEEDGQLLFKWLIHPTTEKHFFNAIWEKRPLMIRRHIPSYANGLFSTEEFNRVLHECNVRYGVNLDVTSYQDNTRETHNPEGKVYPIVVWDYYKNGCSLRIKNPQAFTKPVWRLCATLQEYFKSMVGANIYLTPPGTQGFAPHFDDIEAFVLQLEGKKHWHLYNPRNSSEILPRYSSGNFTAEEIGEKIFDVVLEPGDLLYFPRGFIHQAQAVEDAHSLHITISTYQRHTWGDVMENLVPSALKRAISENIELRRGLPLNYLSTMGMQNAKKNSETRKGILTKISELFASLADYTDVDDEADKRASEFLHDCLPPTLSQSERSRTVLGATVRLAGLGRPAVVQCNIVLETKVRLVRKNAFRLVKTEREDSDEFSYCIYHCVQNPRIYHTEEKKNFEITEDCVPTILFLLDAYPEYKAVRSIPLKSDVDKVNVVCALFEKGILLTEEKVELVGE